MLRGFHCAVVTIVTLIGLNMAITSEAVAQVAFPGPDPGPATAQVEDGGTVRLANAAIAVAWRLTSDGLLPVDVTDRLADLRRPLRGEAFVIQLNSPLGRDIPASKLRLIDGPRIEAIAEDKQALQTARHFAGKQIIASFADADGEVEVQWRASLRDGANYIRQEVSIRALKRLLPLREVVMIDVRAADAHVAGEAEGSPVLAGNLFMACEYPTSHSEVRDGRVQCAWLGARKLTPNPDDAFTMSSVIGVVPPGQLRRGFLHYLDRERATPYRPFLHYNSWAALCWDTEHMMTGALCVDHIERLGSEMVQKRGVKVDSFVFDDGWDDPRDLWRIDRRLFPNGFADMLTAARRYGSTLGTWISPGGGYGSLLNQRVEHARKAGFEIAPYLFGYEGYCLDLSGPRYYARVLETCRTMIHDNGCNYFKIDGIEPPHLAMTELYWSPGPFGVRDPAGAARYDRVEAVLKLVRDLRKEDPTLFINTSGGSWPSPFWLLLSDSTWRMGGDHGHDGKGSKREQWMTYRDGSTYLNIVRGAPLYPLNSLMLSGFCQAQYGWPANNGNDSAEIRREIRSYFATGTNLQELYVTPQLMSAENWDDLAEAAKWSRRNANTLIDTHWIGGDPARSEVYGWASWSSEKGIIALRNPDDRPARIDLELAQVFELPANAPQHYLLESPWRADAGQPKRPWRSGQTRTFELKPFEVIVLEAIPPSDEQDAPGAR